MREKKGGYLGSTSIDRKYRRREDGEDLGVTEVDNIRAGKGAAPEGKEEGC